VVGDVATVIMYASNEPERNHRLQGGILGTLMRFAGTPRAGESL
jgi:hypothetical protein